MASDSDDADFFDKLVDDDDDDQVPPASAAAAADIASLTLDDDDAEEDGAGTAGAPEPAAVVAAPPEPQAHAADPPPPQAEIEAPLAPRDAEALPGTAPHDTEALPRTAPHDTEVLAGTAPHDTEVLAAAAPTDSGVLTPGSPTDAEVQAGPPEAKAPAATTDAEVHEYPPNMLFYAEYPGYYFDTNTQEWFTLEAYQQALTQAATTASALDEIASLTLAKEDGAGTAGAPEPAAVVAAPPEPQAHAAHPPPQAEVEAPVVPPDAEVLAATASHDAEVLATTMPHDTELAVAAPTDAEVLAGLPEAKAPTVATDAEVLAALPEVKASVAAPKAEAAVAPEGGSPGSGKSVRTTTVKQVQWSVFGADSSSAGADPFGDFLAGGEEDAFFVAGVQGLQGSVVAGTSSVGADDHSFFNGVGGSNASSQLDQGTSTRDFLADGTASEDAFFGVQGSAAGSVGAAAGQSFFNGVDVNASSQSYIGASAAEYADQNTNAQSDWASGAVNYSDPNYLDNLYPGFKYDAATAQWYQVATVGGQGGLADNGGAVTVSGSDNVQQQQQLNVSYLQNSSQDGLETIAEEGSTTAVSWGQDQSSAAAAEYPPNMLFYAEYPGYYFDTNTQEWFTLEAYQQAVTQAAFAGAGQSVVHAGNAQASDYDQQSQWQHGSLVNNTHSGSSYSSHQHFGNQISQQAYNEPSKPATDYRTAINTFVPSLEPSTDYQTNTNTFVPSTSQYSNGGWGNQVSNKGFQPTNFQSAHKGFEPQKSSQSTINTFMPSTSQYISGSEGHQVTNKGFEPTIYHSAHKGFEPQKSSHSTINTFMPSTSQHSSGGEGHQVSNKGFEPTSHQSAHKGFEPYKITQSTSTSQDSGNKASDFSVGHQGFKPFTNNQRSTGFVPSSGYQNLQKEFEPSKDNQAHHVALEPSASHVYANSNGFAEPQKSVSIANTYLIQTQTDPATRMHLPNNYLGSENSMNFSQQQAPSQQHGYSPHVERSSAGRPPHALFTFGFGGKLVVMKETSSMTTNFDSRNQGNSRGTLSILNISEVVADKIDQSSVMNGSALGYFYALCRRPIPGPLAGGSAAAKDVNKWLDDIIGSYESSVGEFQGGDAQKLLISLLKISYQHYGKLRSPFGPDPSREGMDGPESAVTALFSSCNSNRSRMREYGAIAHCMKNVPSENQIQATAQEVQNLLVSGRRKDALQYAQDGQLWGPALILALQLGDKFYADTVKKMAYCHFISGSPLRTLCLLIAGQPADVFNTEHPVDANYGTLHRQQQPAEGTPVGMLDDWQQNVAIITANRTKGDDLVVTHLGDCLWKEKNEVAAAHSCYLVAELNIDPYSESARICLLGADHLRCPRTFTSPEAIQRTELYEYSKLLGNSQYILLPFQPYKLIYAYMLAEVGKVSDSLRYCQASLKLLKASGRAPELEAWKQLFSSLEERIRTHQQGGYGTNLAPKLVGKIFSSFDKSLSRMMGTQPAPVPPLSQSSSIDRDIYSAPPANFVNSQSAMVMPSSASEQSVSAMAENDDPDKKGTHNRSVSEPDFKRQQGGGSDNAQSTSGSGSSRFGWLLQKTVGLVSKSSPNQAKLGQRNNFYYDEKLKRWVEEGAEIPAEQPPLAPPPTTASFQNGGPNYNLAAPSSGGYTPNGFAETKPPNPSEPTSGMPPIPPGQNQFSARARAGVRSRYVDTFNKGGGGGGGNAFGAPSYNKPAMPSVNKLPSASFFVPTPAVDASMQMTPESTAETARQDAPSSSPAVEPSYASPPPPMQLQSSFQRHPSMENIMTPSGSGNSSFSRSRAASWSGTYSEQPSSTAASRSPDLQNMQSPPYIPGSRPSHSRSHSNSSLQLNGLGEDLQEVEL
uniref:Uncharacterized protein n=1 Tax=Avena sativa TaxID=4498 RepID=A0ACD6A889_AVESA